MNKTYKILSVLFVMSLLWGSCNFLDEEINIDPNNPLDAPIELLLPSTQANYAYTMGGDFGRYVSLWTQHHSGIERQHAGLEVYGIKEADTSNAWSTMYSEVMNELQIVLDKAAENNSPHYAGVAKVMTAMALGTMVDLFGNVPFSEAFQGADNLNPAYDDAAGLYTTIQTMLDEAIVDLGSASSNFSPGSTDLMLGGDLDAWIEVANTLKARYHLHLTKINGASAATNALNAINAGAISSNANNAQLNFESTARSNPWYAFETERGDVVMGEHFVELMKSIDDPRLPVFAGLGGGGDYLGATAGVPPADPSAMSRFGSALGGATSPVPLVTRAEALFIEAEAAFRTNDLDRAADAHNDAIEASLDQFGVSDDDYLDDQASETDATITLEKILTHKYIAMYTMVESYTDWRRTGIPSLSPAGSETAIARRLPYPGDERLYNSSFPGQVDVFSSVFWDQ